MKYKTYNLLKTSDLNKKDRTNVINLYLEMFFQTEEGEIKIIELTEISSKDPAFFQTEIPETVEKVIALIQNNGAVGIIVDDATEVN